MGATVNRTVRGENFAQSMLAVARLHEQERYAFGRSGKVREATAMAVKRSEGIGVKIE